MSVFFTPLQHANWEEMTMLIKRSAVFLITMLMAGITTAQQTVQLETIGFATLPGDNIEIRLGFNGAPPAPQGFVLDNPARISLDLNGVASALSQQRYELESGNADSVIVLDDGTRTRLIVNLDQLVNYESTIVGNNIVLQVGAGTLQPSTAATSTASTSSNASPDEQGDCGCHFPSRRGQ